MTPHGSSEASMIISMNEEGRVGMAIAHLLDEFVTSLECVLLEPGSYAFRAMVKGGDEYFFVAHRVALDRITFNDLEQVSFDSWPPKGGAL